MLTDLENHIIKKIVFVEDYIQLHIDDYILNILTPISLIESTEKRFEKNMVEKIINEKIEKVYLKENDYLILALEESKIKISLNESDYSGPEAINLINKQKNLWLVI